MNSTKNYVLCQADQISQIGKYHVKKNIKKLKIIIFFLIIIINS